MYRQPVRSPRGSLERVRASLAAHGLDWAAVGTPKAVFSISLAELIRITDGRVEDVI